VAVARIEGTTALRALFETFPELQLTAPPQLRGLVNLRGFTRLPAKLGTRNAASLRA
jgi:cytochrome P450